ncbi:angiopoietin-related protein 7-like [Drosophila obscura]|uniref:angiopoietin-related protein 7-like n=1 Tax=Drosophila obscura TaxID=7282 RepID=UPI001BB24675|nr:angiopoietin-related protein 7-like [Drosophila obscura]
MLIYSLLLCIILHSTALFVGVTEALFDQNGYLITDEMEEMCSAACYPSIKPLFNYVGTCQENDKTLMELQDRVEAQDLKIINLKAQAESLHTQKEKLLDENNCAPHIIVEEAIQQVLLLKTEFNSELTKLQETVEETEEVLAALLQEKLDRIKIAESLQQKENTLKNDELSLKQREESLKLKEVSLQQKENSLNQKKKEDNSNDIRTIRVSGIDPFEAPYESNSAGSDWIVIQRRVKMDVSFDRSWKEYKNGFGSLRGDFFLGLEKIYRLTKSSPQQLYIQNGQKHVKFDHFRIRSELNGYRLKSIGAAYWHDAMDIVDMLFDQVGMRFSTYDRDHDGDCSSNWAKIHGDGWWYKKVPKSLLDFGAVKMMIRANND